MARPREFDRQDALRQAMEAFWDLGYENTTTSVLVERLGIGRSSLYAAFGSKDDLFAEAMDRYVADLRRRVIAPLRAEGPALSVLEDFLLGVAGRGDPGGERLRCCMIVRACISGRDQPPAIRRRIEAAVAELDAAFRDLLARAGTEGSLGPGVEPAGAARFLTTTFQALNVAANAGRSPSELREIVLQALGALTRAPGPKEEP